jgi:hypothetical protein
VARAKHASFPASCMTEHHANEVEHTLDNGCTGARAQGQDRGCTGGDRGRRRVSSVGASGRLRLSLVRRPFPAPT